MAYTKQEIQTLLQKNILSVLFTKTDGTKRAMLCTLDPTHLPVVDKKEGDEVKKTKKQSDETIVAWDLEKNAWRSFRLDSIISYDVQQ
jgi:hypothetical protein